MKQVDCKEEMTFSTPNQKPSEPPVAVPRVKPLSRFQWIQLQARQRAERTTGVCAKGVTTQALSRGSSAGKEELSRLSKDPPPPSSRLEHVDPPSSTPSASPPLKHASEGPSDGNGLELVTTKLANVDNFDHIDSQSLNKSFESAMSGISSLSEILIRRVKTLEQEVSRLEAVEMKSKEETSHLKRDLDSMTKDRDHWMERFTNEVSTGRRFCQSKAGQKLLEEIKSGHLDEFKKSLTFKRLVADEAADIFDRTFEECRKKLKEKGQFSDQDSF